MDPVLARLHDSTERSCDEIVDVALFIKAVDAAQRHIGILYKDPDDAGAVTRELDLRWHHVLGSRAVRVESSYFWAAPSMEPEIAFVIAKLCARIATRYGERGRGIAYALRYAGGRFDAGTGVFMSASGRGLTCATFVMAVFASRGIDLLRWAEWPEREDDRVWQQHIVEHLRRTGAGEEHVEAVNDEATRGCARFRPEEVAAAGTARALPVGFADAERAGQEIVQRLSPQLPTNGEPP
jgi:hypothetical protein